MKKMQVKDEYRWPQQSEHFWEKYKCEWLEDSVYYTSSPTEYAQKYLAHFEIFGKIESVYPYYTERQCLHSYMIMYTYDGEGVLSYRGRQYEIKKNQIFFIDCYEYQYYAAKEQGVWSAYHLHINGNIVEDYYKAFAQDNLVLLDVPECSNISGLFQEFFEKQRITDNFTELLNNKYIVMILNELLLLKRGYYERATIPQYILELQKIIDQHPEEPYNLEVLAKTYGVNKYSLTKKFHQYVGTSIVDYLITVRINTAKKLLHTTNYSIGEVAASVGIEDVSYFSRLFKKKTGKTPKEYRKIWI